MAWHFLSQWYLSMVLWTRLFIRSCLPSLLNPVIISYFENYHWNSNVMHEHVHDSTPSLLADALCHELCLNCTSGGNICMACSAPKSAAFFPFITNHGIPQSLLEHIRTVARALALDSCWCRQLYIGVIQIGSFRTFRNSRVSRAWVARDGAKVRGLPWLRPREASKVAIATLQNQGRILLDFGSFSALGCREFSLLDGLAKRNGSQMDVSIMLCTLKSTISLLNRVAPLWNV